jgi:hypothetical protein
MSKRPKILIALAFLALLGLATVSGLAFYYYSNPSKLKHLAEDALSAFTGMECSISEVSYSQNPLLIRVKGIQLMEHLQGFYLEIPEISAVITIQGGLGQRRLLLKQVRVQGFTLKTAEAGRLPRFVGEVEKGSLMRRILGALFSFFVFKDITVHEAELIDGYGAGQWGDYTITAKGLSATLSPERILEAGGSLRIRSLSKGMDLRIPRLKWITDHPVHLSGPTIRATLRGEDLAFEAPYGDVSSATLETTMILYPQEKALDFESFTLVSDQATAHDEKGTPLFSVPFRVKAKALLNLEEGALSVPSFHGALGAMADLRGEVHAYFRGNREVAVKVDTLRIMLENILPILPALIKDPLEGVGLTGSIHLSGRVAGSLDQHPGQWVCDLEARLQENEITFSSPDSRFRTALFGEVQIKGPVSAIEFHGHLHAADPQARIGALEIEKARLALSMTGVYPIFSVHALDLQAGSTIWRRGENGFSIMAVEGRGRSGSVDLKKKTLRLPELSFHTADLKNLVFSVEITQETLSLDAKAEGSGLIDFGRAMGFLPNHWTVHGTDSLDGRVLLGKGGRLSARADIHIQDLSFESGDGRFVGESISLGLEPSFEGTLGPKGRLNGTLSLSAGKGEILFDRFYLDLSTQPLALSGNGTYGDGGSLDVSGLRIHLKDLGTLAVKGTLDRNRPQNNRFLVHVPKAPLGPMFRQLIVEPFKHRNPSLNDLFLDGFLSLDVELGAQEGHSLWTAKGRCLWQQGRVAAGRQDILLEGIELDLPIWYEHPIQGMTGRTPSAKAPVELEGSLSIESLQLPLLPAQALRTRLKAGPDRLYTLSAIDLVAPGGQIEIGRILARAPFSEAPDIETSLTLKAVDLNPWLSGIWAKPVEASARGKLNPVQWRGDVLTTQGEITAHFFDGEIILSNVGAKRFPSLTPVITLDAAWTDLDLAQLTADTAFGKIQGTLRGHAKRLEIADGQPQAFDLFMETVKKKDIPQKISVQAVDNIARIGGGASPFRGLAGAFVSFFRELPYEKIGVRAVLENDVFRINGTIRGNGKEYLIKKGGFSGVDVIIGTPGSNTISFKDMVNRIKRVADSQEGPVIE